MQCTLDDNSVGMLSGTLPESSASPRHSLAAACPAAGDRMHAYAHARSSTHAHAVDETSVALLASGEITFGYLLTAAGFKAPAVSGSRGGGPKR